LLIDGEDTSLVCRPFFSGGLKSLSRSHRAGERERDLTKEH
jgi:hypothetical protein